MNEEGKKELVNYRIAKAKETIGEVPTLIENEFWNTAVNRIYYACYYAVVALLIQNDVKTRSHSGARQMFGLHFIKTGLISSESGKFFSDIFDMRQVGDYDDFIDYKEDDVRMLVEPAKNLINEVEQLLKQGN